MNKSEKFWDRTAKPYESREINLKETQNKTAEQIKQYLNADDIVLDFACGTGVITAILAENVKEITGIDYASKVIEVAKRIAKDNNITNIEFEQTTIFDEKYTKESFDVITGVSILHLIEDLQEVLRRIDNLLRPGGLFISLTPCLREKGSFLGRFMRLLSKIKLVPYLNSMTYSELEDLLREANFEIVEAEDIEGDQMTLFIVAKKT